jgi:hypothetical protein
MEVQAMSQEVNQYYTLDRDPDSEEWDTCPGCGESLRSRGEDEHRDDYEIYEFFVCDNEDCRVKEAVVRA